METHGGISYFLFHLAILLKGRHCPHELPKAAPALAHGISGNDLKGALPKRGGLRGAGRMPKDLPVRVRGIIQYERRTFSPHKRHVLMLLDGGTLAKIPAMIKIASFLAYILFCCRNDVLVMLKICLLFYIDTFAHIFYLF